MPESPEVQLMIDNINSHLRGKKTILKDIVVLSGRYKTHGQPKDMKRLRSMLPLNMAKLQKKGKFIYFKLAGDKYVMFTMGMTGHLMWEGDTSDFFEMRDKYRRIRFDTNVGSFYFLDMRNFGTISFCFDTVCLNKKLDSIGPDVLSSEFSKLTTKRFRDNVLEKSKKNDKIGEVIVNQNVYSGVGNYLRSEILYSARIYPFKTIEKMTLDNYRQLLGAMKKIPKRFYTMQKRSELHDYHFEVYKQRADSKGNEVVAKKLGVRNVYFVPKLQK